MVKKKISKKPKKEKGLPSAIASPKEKISEIYEIENKKTGEEKEVVKNSEISDGKASKKDIQNNEKQLKIILWIIGFVFLTMFLVIVGLKMVRTVHYENTKFEIVQEGELIFYNTVIPIYKEGEHIADYNFYLRTNPKDLKNVPLEGDLLLRKGYTINVTTNNLFCDGDWSIAIANLQTQYSVAGAVLINDVNATCDDLSRYTYFEIKEGNETKIVQRDGKSCYDIYVSNCEIIPATEKIMAETFVYLNG